MRTLLASDRPTEDRPAPARVPPARSRLGWLPVPLAVLAALLGWLLLASLPGLTAGHHHGYQASGLALTVEQMTWMSNDMTGQGPLAVPKGFPMDPGMMPGMQAPGDNRLRLEVLLQNVSNHVQHYARTEFELLGSGGQSWKATDDGGYDAVTVGALRPGFQVTIDLYFDVPSQQSSHLTVSWSRDGSTVHFPVNVNGVPSPHIH